MDLRFVRSDRWESEGTSEVSQFESFSCRKFIQHDTWSFDMLGQPHTHFENQCCQHQLANLSDNNVHCCSIGFFLVVVVESYLFYFSIKYIQQESPSPPKVIISKESTKRMCNCRMHPGLLRWRLPYCSDFGYFYFQYTLLVTSLNTRGIHQMRRQFVAL